MNLVSLLFLAVLSCPVALHAEDLGDLSANPFGFDSTANPFGAGSPFAANGINNPFSPYGSPFSNQSATNPFDTDAPRLYDQSGYYGGKLSANPFDPDSEDWEAWVGGLLAALEGDGAAGARSTIRGR